jgi:hypothetical protein
MLADFSLLEVSFKLLLFGILVGNLIYLYKKYAVPFLYQEIIEEKNARTMLLEKERLLASTYHRIENQVQQQKKMFVLLEKNVQAWHQAMNEEIEKNNKEAAAEQQALIQKRIIQKKYLANALLGKAVIPQSIALARHDLIEGLQAERGSERLAAMVKELEKHKACVRDSNDVS